MELDDGSVDTVLAGIDDSFLEEQQDMNSINVNISLNDELDRIASIDSSLWVESLLQEDVDNSTVVSFERHEDDVGWTGTECGAHPREDQHIVIRQVSNIADVAAAQQSLTQPINVPTFLDVVNGCGRGILKLPGNETYRELVSLNKRIYARCHHLDKAKVSHGIVAAIRDFGGRFLEYDGESKTYHDIGDNRARKKTSQALREGQKKIRRQMSSDMATGRRMSGLDADLLGSLHVTLPVEKYVEFSVQMLQVLHDK
jgi:hypothetical protein